MARATRVVFALMLSLLPAAAGAAPAAKPAAAPAPLHEYPNAPPTQLVVPVHIGLEGFRGVLSADGKWLVAADNQEATVAVFDAAAGRRLRDLQPFARNRASRQVGAVALSADGKVLVAGASSTPDGSIVPVPQINVWDFATGRERWAFTGMKRDLYSLSLSADGRWLAGAPANFGATPGELRLWDLSTGKPIISMDDVPDAEDCCVSPDGKAFVWLGSKAWHAYDVATAKETAVVPINTKSSQRSVRISPDGKTMVTVGERLAILWDFPTRAPKKVIFGGWTSSSRPCFTADGRQVVLAFAERAVYFNTATGDAVGAITCARPKYSPVGLSMTGDGKVLVTVGDDRVRLFDATRLEPPPPMPPAPDPKALVMGEIPDMEGGTGGISETGKPGKRPGKAAAAAIPQTPVPTLAPQPITPPVGPASGGTTHPSASSQPPATPIAPVHPPPAVPPSRSPAVPPAAADPAAALVGKWTAEEDHFQDVWTVEHIGQKWKVSAIYTKGSVESGAAHGEDVQYADGVLTFTRVFDKKPARAFSDATTCTMRVKEGRLDYSSSTGSKTKRITFDRVAGT